MADVDTLQQVVVIADDGASLLVGASVDNHILTDDIVVANLHIRLLTTVVEVLRQGGNDGTLVNFVLLADAGSVQDADEGEDDTVVTYLHVVLNIDEGEYLTVVADFRLGRYLSFRTNFGCHK